MISLRSNFIVVKEIFDPKTLWIVEYQIEIIVQIIDVDDSK